MTASGIDPDQIARYTRTLLRYAEEGSVVVLRAFYDDERARKESPPSFKTYIVRLNGAGLDPVIKMGVQLAEKAAAFTARPIVACLLPTTFTGKQKENKSVSTAEEDVKEGLALAVECDQHPTKALATLRAILGPPTFVIASGGEWTDPEIGEVKDRLHLYWLLKEPTTDPEGHARIKRARRLACELIGADGSGVPLVHPMRCPGSLHRGSR